MATLENLYRADLGIEVNVQAYDAARQAAVERIRSYLAEHTRDGLNLDIYAQELMERAEESGLICGDEVSGEIAAGNSRTQHAIPFTV